jgi:hypothetical protein
MRAKRQNTAYKLWLTGLYHAQTLQRRGLTHYLMALEMIISLLPTRSG